MEQIRQLTGRNARRTLLTLVTIGLGLFAVHTILQLADRAALLGQLNWFVSRLDPDAERNLPTLYNTALLAAGAAMLAHLAVRSRSWWWGSLAAVFTYVAADEWLGIHERSIVPLRDAFQAYSGVFYFTWVIPAIGIVAILGVVFSRFIIGLPSRTKRLLMLAAGLYLAGALGGDMLSGGLGLAYGSLHYSMTAAIEELLEWQGLAVMLYALLDGYDELV